MRDAIDEALRKRGTAKPLGERKLLERNPFSPPPFDALEGNIHRLTEPRFKSSCSHLSVEYREGYFTFKSLFQSASYELRRALKLGWSEVSLRFPPYGIPLFGGGGEVMGRSSA